MADKSSEYEYFKSEFDNFKKVVEKGFFDLNAKIDKILDPQTGLIRTVDRLEGAITRAHERIDEQSNDIDELSKCIHGNSINGRRGIKSKVDNLESFIDTFRKVIWKIVTPILALLGIGLIVMIAILLPKVSKAIEIINKINP